MKPITKPDARADSTRIGRERYCLLLRLEKLLEGPMVFLGFVWLGLLLLELTRGLVPWMETVSLAIWVLFLGDFILRFVLAPKKAAYLKSNALTAVSLLVPALRVLRITQLVRVLRAGRAVRGLRLVKVIGSLNRGMRALDKAMRRRGVGYVMLLTVLVTFVGAAGMYAFERDLPSGRGLNDYGTALWWTAMIMTTLGSEYWPHTGAGRLLCLVLALYAFGVFGYVTAAIASFFVGLDASEPSGEIAGAEQIKALHREIAALRAEIREHGIGREP